MQNVRDQARGSLLSRAAQGLLVTAALEHRQVAEVYYAKFENLELY